MDWWLVSFFLGALLSLFFPIVPEFSVLFLLLLFSIIFFYYSFKTNPAFFAISGLLFGVCWMITNAFNFQQLWQENNINKADFSAKAHWVEGQVLSLYSAQTLFQPHNDNLLAKKIPENNALKDKIVKNNKFKDKSFQGNSLKAKSSNDTSMRFNFKMTHLNNHKLTNAIQLRLSWKNPTFSVEQGQTVKLKVKSKPAHGLANLGSFSYQTWLNSHKLSATGYVINHKDNHIVTQDASLRQKLFTSYKSLLPQDELSPLLLALGFGSRSDLSPHLWDILQKTGTGHLIAISGLHVGLVAMGSYYLFILLIRLLPLHLVSFKNHLQSFNIRYLAIAFSITVAIGYGYLAGFSLPTIRALVMLSLFWIVKLLGVNLSLKRWLLLTLFLLTLIEPFSLFTASFWLSVYAVIIIFLTLWRFKSFISVGSQWWRFIKGLLVIQLSLTFMLMPISAIFFQQISLLSLAANIVAVPWMSFLSIPLCLLSVIFMPLSEPVSIFFIGLCLESVIILWQYLLYLTTFSWSVIELSKVDVQLSIFLGCLAAFFLFFVPNCVIKNKIRLLISGSVVVLLYVVMVHDKTRFQADEVENFSNQASQTQRKNWQLIVFDVGQGLSILIKQNHKAMLYDTGAAYPSSFNMIEAVVLPYLQYANIHQLDHVILSHGDNDHAGGLALLQKAIKIEQVRYNEQKQGNLPCLQGQKFAWQQLTVQVLWPEKALVNNNDDSCVLLISDRKHQVLLTGDISKKVEDQLLERYPKLRADVLIVPHHGSKTSSSNRFISQINPAIGVVSAGYLNRWKMPVTDVVKRYQTHGVPLLNSAETGQIIINFSDKGMAVQTYRHDLWPFWFAH